MKIIYPSISLSISLSLSTCFFAFRSLSPFFRFSALHFISPYVKSTDLQTLSTAPLCLLLFASLINYYKLLSMTVQVGEEYLLLLPECLPFLSELLEDDSADVIAATGELIRYIEELSGEKLDAFLQ